MKLLLPEVDEVILSGCWADEVAVRTVSQIMKGKYVEVDSEDDSLSDPADDPDDGDFEGNEVEVLSEVAVQDTPKPKFEEDDDDIYGEQFPTTYPTASKKRKLNNATATPSSSKSKSSTSSGVFSPVDALDTPATSVSDSFHTKVTRGIRS